VGPRFEEIEAELEALSELREKPADTIRITATEYATDAILLPKIARLLREYPDIKVEIAIDYGLTDIVGPVSVSHLSGPLKCPGCFYTFAADRSWSGIVTLGRHAEGFYRLLVTTTFPPAPSLGTVPRQTEPPLDRCGSTAGPLSATERCLRGFKRGIDPSPP